MVGSRPVLIPMLAIPLLALNCLAKAAGNAPAPPTGQRLASILADFETDAAKWMKDWQVPGMAVAIVRGDQIIYTKAFGVRETGRPEPVDVNTVFQIGSTSKAFTAALVAMMIDEGRLKWQDKVVDLAPQFMMYDPWVTRQFEVVDLMSQRSGLPSYAGDVQSILGFDRDHIIHSLRYLHPTTSFRSAFGYQNSLFLVAAALVEKSTGKSWERNLRERLFAPLEMPSSSSTLEALRSVPNHASLHHKTDGKVVVIPLDQRWIDWNYIYGPAGGINSTVVDLTHWMQMQLSNGVYKSKRLVSAANIRYMHEPKIYGKKGTAYCVAWIKTDYRPYPLIWHNGGTSGIKSIVQLVPEAGLGMVVLTNLSETMLPEALGRRFVDLYFGNPPHDWNAEYLAESQKKLKAAAPPPRPASPDPPLPLDQYTGVYTNPVYGDAVVALRNGTLVTTIGPNQLDLALQPWNRDTFMVDQKEVEVTTAVEFDLDTDKTPTSFTARGLNEAGEGLFTRAARK